MIIRTARDADADPIWRIFRAVVAGRDSYVFAPDTPRDEALAYWFGPGIATWVAEDAGRVVGMYKLIANQRDLGSHVANASFMVHPDAAGRGVGRTMGEHCLREARLHGYDAMQFNFVVSSNAAAVRLWQSLGFTIVGTLPKAFRHARLGLVDAYAMHRRLDDIILTFGRSSEQATIRHCAYAVLVNQAGAIPVVEASEGIMLPGGGLDPGELHEHAVVREVEEECALQVCVAASLGEAIHFVSAKRQGGSVEKRKRYYVCEIVASASSAPHHPVRWLPPDEALVALTSDADKWAVRRWLRLYT